MKKIIKILKIIGLTLLIILSAIGSVFLIVFFSKKNKTNIDKYTDKINKLLQEKKKNEETISNSNYDDYNSDGSLRRK